MDLSRTCCDSWPVTTIRATTIPEKRKTPLPPPFKRDDLSSANPVEASMKAGLQRERAAIIEGASARDAEYAAGIAFEAEGRERSRAANEKSNAGARYERSKTRAGAEFEQRRQQDISRSRSRSRNR